MHEQQTISREDPMFDHVESIDFSATFCFTGEFAFGDRKACEQATAQLGATVKPRPVKTGKCYVVVGTLQSAVAQQEFGEQDRRSHCKQGGGMQDLHHLRRRLGRSIAGLPKGQRHSARPEVRSAPARQERLLPDAAAGPYHAASRH